MDATTSGAQAKAVKATSTGSSSTAVEGTATQFGVRGVGDIVGVQGETTATSGTGVKGASTNATGVRGDSSGGNGVFGTTTANGFAGVRGQSSGGGVPTALSSRVFGTSNGGGSFGVSGHSNGGGGTGVYGVGTFHGVRARAVFDAPTTPPPSAGPAGLVAEGVDVLGGVPAAGIRASSSSGVGAQLTGAAADVHLVAGAAGPSRLHSSGHAVGELAMESNGVLWVCVAAGAAGQAGAWKRVAYVEDLPPGFDPGSLTGVFSAPPKPGRVYDSRIRDGKLAGRQSRNVSVATTLEGAEIVPARASAAVVTITLDQTEGQGFLSVFPSNVAFPGTSSINWFTNGQILANGGTVTMPADRTVTVLAGGAGATHFIIDIAGVYT